MALADADYLGTLLDMFELEEPKANDALSERAVKTSTLQLDNPGQAFLNWIKEGILSNRARLTGGQTITGYPAYCSPR